MKIDKFEAARWLCHNRANLAFTPVTMIASSYNGAGKSAIGDGIAYALTGELRRIGSKGDRDQLAQEGGEGPAFVGIDTSWGKIRRDVATGKTVPGATSIEAPADMVSSTLQFSIDPERFEKLTPDDRRSALLAIMRVNRQPDAILLALTERGHPASLLERMPADKPFGEWEAVANAIASEQRGAWKAITKEAYGAKKAETWSPPAVTAPDADEIAQAEQEAAKCKAAVEQLIGDVATMKANAGHAARHADLVKAARFLPAAQDYAVTKRAELDEAEVALARANAAEQDIRQRLHHASGQPCPHCDGLIEVRKGVDGKHELVAYVTPANPATMADLHAAHQKAVKALEAQRDAKAALSSAEAAVRNAETAKAELDRFPSTSDAAGAGRSLEDLERFLSAAREKVAASNTTLTELRDRIHKAQEASQIEQRALEAHRAVVGALALAADLAPSGLPAEWAVKAIERFNLLLRQMADMTGWRQVTIRPDMHILSDGRRHEMTSRGQRWRTNAMLAVAIAHFGGARFVVLDDFDVLQVADRMPALKWLHKITQPGGVIDSAVIMATLKERPKLPPSVAVHWLDLEPESIQAAA